MYHDWSVHFKIPPRKVLTRPRKVTLYINRRVMTRQAAWYHLQVFSTITSWSIGKKLLMTLYDLRWPLPVLMSVNGTYVITDAIICHNPERIEWFWPLTRSGTHFDIFPKAYDVKISNLTWPQVTEIKILRYTNCTYWHPYEHTKRWNCTMKNSTSGITANFSEVGSTNLLWWPDPATFLPDAGNEYLGKVTKYELDISSRLGMARRKTWGGLFGPAPLAVQLTNII